MSDWEKDHIAAAFAFELNQVVDQVVRSRTMNEILVNIDPDLAAMVSEATGIAIAPAGTREAPTPSAPTPAGPLKDARSLKSAALSMDKPPPTIKGRKVAVLVGDGVDTAEVEAILAGLADAELLAETIGPRAGAVAATDGPLGVNRAAPNAPSVVYDAILVPSGIGPALAVQTLAQRFVHEAWRHGKPIAVAPDAQVFLEAAGVPVADQGIAVVDAPQITRRLIADLSQHRFPRRASMLKPA
jgi:catalase